MKSLKSNSHLLKKFICFNENLLKIMKNAFYFILKALFILNKFKLLSWHFGHIEKTTWLERGKFQNRWSDNMVNKQLHHTYCAILHKLKANIFQRNIFIQKSCREWDRETNSRLFFKNALCRQGNYCNNLATRAIPFFIVSKSSVGETTSEAFLPHFSKDSVA